ncbi:molybdopterin-dependent oxidoreductase [Paramaledivibacter caminithermalis]|uniref:Anaerobic selenocysteine-containing dehydrogenase n=1 Tax=Paramaledivibacter caminithermalis (strain DSM 15212 / CIP 107654 / DViRD3) TaxID=1121301 RepID=A0A1M6LF93_PARC5|nr:molybdopterin-dependent oxidoreductase [Paramaledivibacter caminithermalis]SHJ69808.1 Anaerobic selenocysteine-containing dehydrogenase [Paramaledivibacter caminithermalis DSM 15212]
MSKTKIRFSCPLDCFDVCSMIATVKEGKIIKIEGDKEHPLTKGFICQKGRKHLERVYHPNRILSPKKKYKGKWIDISYQEAIEEIAEKLNKIKKEYGSKAVLHFYDSGYGGLSKTVDKMFFNYYGGATVHTGSLCWGAGIEAQKIDFGGNKSHPPEDLINSKTIIIWGRNPADTNIHLMKYLTKAKKNGAYIYLIDPIRTRTAKMVSEYMRIKPSTDGALALGIANYMIQKKLIDEDFIKKNVKGYEDYKKYVRDFTLEYTQEITGIHRNKIKEIAERYSKGKPSSIIIGYGLQRYKNGGNNVRAIDALGALTGNIGIKGGGVNYSNKLIAEYIGGEVKKSEDYVKDRRTYSQANLARFILEADNPPIKCLFITKSNPLVQVPNINKTIEAFNKVDFKVVIDMFMTDTVRYSDLVLPATSILEEEDFIYSSMFSPYLNYSNRVVKPPNGIMGEYDLFRILARKIKLRGYPDIEREEFFKRALEPLMKNFDVSYEYLKHNFFTIEDRDIPWEDKVFNTPSCKYELYSETAKDQGLSPIPIYISANDNKNEYDLRLITPHFKNSLHSQHFAFEEDIPRVYINTKTLKKNNIKADKTVKIKSKYGELKAKLEVSEDIGDGIIMIYEGWWHKSGSVNFVTPDEISDIGEQAAYYECFCKLENL